MIHGIDRMKRRDEEGFTLIELLVVIIILGILSAVVVFAVRGAGDKGKAAAFTTDEKTIRTAEEAYCAKNGFYGTGNDLVAQKFLSELPTLHTVTAGSGGTCTGGGDHTSKTGFSTACGDTEPCSTLNIAMSGDGQNRNSLAQWTPASTGVYEQLTKLNPDYTVSPWLAASWDIIAPANAGGQMLVGGVPTGARVKNDSTGGACVGDSPGPGGTNPSSVPPGATYAFATGAGTDPACSPAPASHTFRFHIRTNGGPANARILFHDGVPLTAMAVKLGMFDRLGRGSFFNPTDGARPDTQNDSAQLVDNTCTNPDNCLVDYTPRTDNLRIPEQIVHPGSMAIESPNTPYFFTDPNTFALSCFHFNPDTGAKIPETGSCTSNATAHPIGTGPFTFVQWTQGTSLTVTRNPTWWQGRSAAKTLNFSYVSDSNTRKSLLESGQADLYYDTNPDHLAPLLSEGFLLKAATAPGEQVTLNQNSHPDPAWDCTTIAPPGECHSLLSDLNVRMAVSSAVDRNAYLTAIYGGQGTTQATEVAPGILGASASLVTGIAFNQAQANTLLTNAGWTYAAGDSAATCTPTPGRCRKNVGGRELRLALPYNVAGTAAPALVQSMLQAVGIGVDIVTPAPTGPTSFNGRVTSGQGDLFLYTLGASTDGNPGWVPRNDLYNGPTAAYSAGPYSTVYGITPGSYNKRFGPDAPFNADIDQSYRDLTDAQAAADVADAMHSAIDLQARTSPLGAFKRLNFTGKTVTGFTMHPAFSHIDWSTISKTGP